MAYCQGCADSERQVDMLKTLLSEARAALADAERQLQRMTEERTAFRLMNKDLLERAEAAESKLSEAQGTLRTLVERAIAGIEDVAAQSSLCLGHMGVLKDQADWCRREVNREAQAAIRQVRAILPDPSPPSSEEGGSQP
jgi:chromosome segregation ATPase